MSPELENYFGTYKLMFSTDGWKQFIKDLSDTKVSTEQIIINKVSEEKELFFFRGKLDILNRMLSFEETILAQEQVASEDDESEYEDI